MENTFFTKERAVYAVIYYLITVGVITNAVAGTFIYREYNKPGTAVMFGDLGGVDTPKGKAVK